MPPKLRGRSLNLGAGRDSNSCPQIRTVRADSAILKFLCQRGPQIQGATSFKRGAAKRLLTFRNGNVSLRTLPQKIIRFQVRSSRQVSLNIKQRGAVLQPSHAVGRPFPGFFHQNYGGDAGLYPANRMIDPKLAQWRNFPDEVYDDMPALFKRIVSVAGRPSLVVCGKGRCEAMPKRPGLPTLQKRSTRATNPDIEVCQSKHLKRCAVSVLLGPPTIFATKAVTSNMIAVCSAARCASSGLPQPLLLKLRLHTAHFPEAALNSSRPFCNVLTIRSMSNAPVVQENAMPNHSKNKSIAAPSLIRVARTLTASSTFARSNQVCVNATASLSYKRVRPRT
jgi:hypothetical protein